MQCGAPAALIYLRLKGGAMCAHVLEPLAAVLPDITATLPKADQVATRLIPTCNCRLCNMRWGCGPYLQQSGATVLASSHSGAPRTDRHRRIQPHAGVLQWRGLCAGERASNLPG